MTIITDTMTRENIINIARSWGWKEDSAQAFAESIEQLRKKFQAKMETEQGVRLCSASSSTPPSV